MQTAAGLERVARDCVEDLANDGIIYAGFALHQRPTPPWR